MVTQFKQYNLGDGKKGRNKSVIVTILVIVGATLIGSGCKDVATGEQFVPNGVGGYLDPTSGVELSAYGSEYLDTSNGELLTLNGTSFYDATSGVYIGYVYSQNSSTRDTDLQQAQLQQLDQTTRAQAIATQFQMSFSSAVQLTQLTDQLNSLKMNGQAMTESDRDAVTAAALKVAGLSGDELNAAVTQLIQSNDQTAVNALLEKAASNLGMSSSTTLRNQLLPSLGISLD